MGRKVILLLSVVFVSDLAIFLVADRFILSRIPDVRTLPVYLLTQAVILAVLLTVLGAVLDRLVLSRIRRMALQARGIQKDPENAGRLPRSGSDELDRLAGTMNELLNALVSARSNLRHDAYHDVLTGLGNRGMLMDRLAFLHSLLNRDPSYAFTVLLLDLDGFKDVNDAFGHEAGDHVLKIIARRLVSLVRKSDTVARMGGDEFVILLYKTSSHEQTDVFVNKLMKAVREPIPWENQELMVSCSVGVMQDIDRCSGSAPGELLRDVDIAMYQAKRSGKNQSRRFSCELRGAVTDNMSLMTELRKSIRENRLEVWHQPIVRISDERLMGTEALLRWYHPSRGLVMPGIFIPLAEEANLIVQLDHWALMLAVEHMKEIRKVVPEAYVSVNFSMRQFLHPNISRLIARTLQTEQIPAGSLAVELTESMLVRNERQLSNAIGNIRATGIRLFLDDFGTGYSSLHRLQELPFDVIKIDQSFIRRVESDDIHIVEAVIRMAHSLGKKVIAEGVESRKQWDILKGLDCDYVQGFLMSKPLPLKELLEWINVRLRSGPVTSS